MQIVTWGPELPGREMLLAGRGPWQLSVPWRHLVNDRRVWIKRTTEGAAEWGQSWKWVDKISQSRWEPNGSFGILFSNSSTRARWPRYDSISGIGYYFFKLFSGARYCALPILPSWTFRTPNGDSPLLVDGDTETELAAASKLQNPNLNPCLAPKPCSFHMLMKCPPHTTRRAH